MNHMKRIGLAPNPSRDEAIKLTSRVADWLAERSVRVVVTSEVAEKIGRPDLAATDEDVVDTDLVLILGGDGTMLRWSRLAAPMGTPMMGVNFGQYGFITEVHPDETIDALTLVLDGKYYVSERVVLQSHSHQGLQGNRILFCPERCGGFQGSAGSNAWAADIRQRQVHRDIRG